ncbi:type I polyketide synthase [Nocardia sp. NPDC003482]
MSGTTEGQAAESDPIAVIGTSCRFAGGVDSPDTFWEMLVEGRYSVSEIPADRWEQPEDARAAAVWRRTTRRASVLDDVAGFDAAFFGISPREAVMIDPQHRIVLELAWEALEHAGLPVERLRGTDAGVFVAATSHDYSERLRADLRTLEAWAVNGANAFGISNRISFALDLHGPSMTVDTACAGSLNAIHLACGHLWRGEIPLAVVGGVNVIAGPGSTVALEGTGATAADGRCKAFDAAADGYGRGEGAAVVVLKRYSDAVADGDRVLALIRGTGAFHDGTGDGFMTPNGEAQERMLRAVYRRFGIDPASVDYVEAHGTGTPVGDPIEAATLSRFFGAHRTADDPCLIGSVKPNIGHLEAGAGIAGVIKTVLALNRGRLPASLHTELTPSVDWAASGLRVVPALMPWPRRDGPRRAGVSGFGVGGAIGHVILEQAPERTAEPHSPNRPGPWVFPLSARSEAGVRAAAGRLADWLQKTPEVPLSAVAATLATRRSHLQVRAAVTAANGDELADALRNLAAGNDIGAERARVLPTDRRDPVWVFSGQGAQWSGMGRELLREEPGFAEVIDRLGRIFEQECGFTPRAAIEAGDWSSPVRTQAMVFAMQVALAHVWFERGLRPGAIIGHSTGEIAAAVVAGVLDLEPAARFNCRRAVALADAAGKGAMAMVNLPFAQARQRVVAGAEAAVSAAPGWTVVSGDADAVRRATRRWSDEGVVVRPVDTSIAFHSHLLDPFVADVIDAARCLTPRDPRIPLYSTVTADPRSTAPRDATYWGTAVREPVRFVEAIGAAAEDGHRMFLEVSSHPIVAHSVSEILDEFGHTRAAVAHSLRRDRPELATLLTNLAHLHCHGAAVDWSRSTPGGDPVDLPTMAWQHQPYWISPASDSTGPAGHDPDSHTLLGAPHHTTAPTAMHVWETAVDFDSRPYPGRHRLLGVEILPAAVLLATFATAVAGPRTERWPVVLRQVEFRFPLVLDGPQRVQIVSHAGQLSMTGRTAEDERDAADPEANVVHATAAVESEPPGPGDRADIAAIRRRCGRGLSWRDAEDRFTRNGVTGYGFDWQLEDLRTGSGEFLTAASVSDSGAAPLSRWAPLLDAALTALQLIAPEDDRPRVLAGIGTVALHGIPDTRLLVHGVGHEDGTLDIRVLSNDGSVRAELLGVRLEAVEGALDERPHPRELVHRLSWEARSADGGAAPEEVVLLGEDPSVLAALRKRHAENGIRCTVAAGPDDVAVEGAAVVVLPSASGPADEAAERNTWALVRAAQSLAAARRDHRPRLWCVTRGVRAGENAADGALWGVARVLAGEHPEFWGGLIDLDPDAPLEAVADVVGRHSGEDVLALGAGGVLAPRLRPADNDSARTEFECRADSSYLVVGGLGALGRKTALWLAERGARRLVLTGRHGLPPRGEWDTATGDAADRIADVRALEALGVTVHILAFDCADADATAAALAELDIPPIRGVVHAAGVSDGTLLTELTRESLTRVLRPKIRGAAVLDRLFPPGAVDFFVLFSSCGQLARITGQSAYAAANAFLDALAARRRAAGCVGTVSLAWNTVLDTGMSVDNTAAIQEAETRGFGSLGIADVFRAWQFAARCPQHYLAVTPVVAAAANPVPLLDGSVCGSADSDEDTPEWQDVPDGERAGAILSDVREQISAELRMPAEELEPERPLSDLGVDSVFTVRLRTRINRRYRLELPPTLFWDRPTVEAIAAHVAEETAKAERAAR